MFTKKVIFFTALTIFTASMGLGATSQGSASITQRQPPPPKTEISGMKPESPAFPSATRSSPAGSPFVVGNQSVDAVYPAVAYNTIDIYEEYLVVWQNDRPGNDDIYGQLVSKNGNLNGGWRSIAAGQGAERRYPDVVYNPNWNEYLVVWEHLDSSTGNYSIRGQRVAWDGIPQGGEIIISASGPYSGFTPAVTHAFTSGIYLVVWTNHTQGNVSSDIKGQLVSNDGSLIGGNFDIAQGVWQFSHDAPDAAYNRRRNEYLVVWQRLDKTPSLNDIYAQVVRPDGTMPPSLIEIARYTVSSTSPAVAAIPTATAEGEFLVVWELHYASGNRDIYGRFVYGNGSADISDFPVINVSGDQENPAVAGSESGNQYLVTWNQPSTPPLIFVGIRGKAISPTGVSMSSESPVGGIFADNSAVASGPLSDFLVAYDDIFPGEPNRDVWGELWGHRIYLPLLYK